MSSPYTKGLSRFQPFIASHYGYSFNYFNILEVGTGYSTVLLGLLEDFPTMEAVVIEPHDYDTAESLFRWALANLDLPQKTIDRIERFREIREKILNHSRIRLLPITLREFVETNELQFDGVMCVAGPNGYPDTQGYSTEEVEQQLDSLVAPSGFRI